MAEEYQWLLEGLVGEALRGVARWEREGRTDRTIAVALGCLEEPVERPLESLRRLRSEEVKS
jgi:hypothetical protein